MKYAVVKTGGLIWEEVDQYWGERGRRSGRQFKLDILELGPLVQRMVRRDVSSYNPHALLVLTLVYGSGNVEYQ